jgi:sensor c-di-GMP phosphodiesterase-like protein
VSHVQGWLYAKAMPIDAFKAFLAERNRDTPPVAPVPDTV